MMQVLYAKCGIFVILLAQVMCISAASSLISGSESYISVDVLNFLGNEKHFSNPNKKILFEMFMEQNKVSDGKVSKPVVFIHDVSYSEKNGFVSAEAAEENSVHCNGMQDDYSVVFLSNFSVSRNYSHFLHGLLRLFCALLDAQWIIFNEITKLFEFKVRFTLWMDRNWKLTERNVDWLGSLVESPESLRFLRVRSSNGCNVVSTKQLLYGSGCYQMLPPEKWFGYAGCRAGELLPLFSAFMKQRAGLDISAELSKLEVQLTNPGQKNSLLVESTATLFPLKSTSATKADAITVFKPEKIIPVMTTSVPVTPIMTFAIRNQEKVTGQRVISNLFEVQSQIYNNMRMPLLMTNVTFELLTRRDMISLMSNVHVFVSVHGAGMTNMFFMSPRSVVIEIIPWPLCDCKSPDYFYGMGGYYHGSAIAGGMRHYAFCVPKEDTNWVHDTKHIAKESIDEAGSCSWKYLHSVDSLHINPARFLSFYRMVERDLVASGVIRLTEHAGIISKSAWINQ